jgi:signal transduction histidine kinase
MVGAGKGTGRFGVGTRWEHNDLFPSTRVFQTGRPVRVGRGEVEANSEPMAEVLRRERLAGTVACPIVVDGRLWGTIAVSTREDVLPIDSEERLEKFTELVATAISNAHARSELARIAEEQAALRRVATLIADDVPPADLFVAVPDEVGRVFGTGLSTALRFEHDPPAAVMVGATEAVLHWFPVGTRVELEGPLASAEVYRSGRPARVDARDWSVVTGPVGETGRGLDVTSTVACPISVEGRLWGAMMVSDAEGALLPPNTEERLQKFTDLVAMAISNAHANSQLARLAEEQAALRRMATLVAEGAPAADIFGAVCNEVGALVGAETAAIVRFETDPPSIRVVGVGRGLPGIGVGTVWELDDALASTEVYRTGRSARIDNRDPDAAVGPIHEPGRRLGLTCTVAAPILVAGKVWGTVSVSSTEPSASDTESKLERFGDLVATAIANADSRAQLAASRRRIVAASDETRRRIERDLHDGMQQRLVSLALVLRAAERIVPPGSADLKSEVAAVAAALTEAVDELREISSGIHPAIISQGGLSAALRTLARRSSLPVALDVAEDLHADDQIEVAAYFVASEVLTNSTKHAHASELALSLRQQDGALLLCVRDNGVGGADPTGGSGLTGLTDRVEALGGSISIDSPAGEGTAVNVRLPLEPAVDDPVLPN